MQKIVIEVRDGEYYIHDSSAMTLVEIRDYDNIAPQNDHLVETDEDGEEYLEYFPEHPRKRQLPGVSLAEAIAEQGGFRKVVVDLTED